MKHCSSLLTPAQCLLQALAPATTSITRTLAFQKLPALPFSPQGRFVSHRPLDGSTLTTRRQAKAVTYDRLSEWTKDEDIQAHQVVLKSGDVYGQGSLSEPQTLRHLLRDIDREKQVIIQLTKPGDREFPIVQIANKDDLRKRVRDKEKAAKKVAQEQRERKPKQIEMNWAISGHDMEIKLRQLENFLEKGKKVEVLLAAKRRGRKAELEEGDAVLRKIREKLGECDAKEVGQMEGQVLKQALLVVQKRGVGG